MRRACEFLSSTFLLAAMAHPLSVTFQRAFGFSCDLNDSLDAVVKTDDQSEYPLRAVSPQLPTVSLWLAQRAGTAAERLVIVLGGGSNAANVAQNYPQVGRLRDSHFTERSSADFLSGSACDRTLKASARYPWTKVRKLKELVTALAFTEQNDHRRNGLQVNHSGG
jgi:copper homeostasis protein CutC